MNDSLGLLGVGLLVSALAWLFWSQLGADALNVGLTLALIGAAAENRRLRKALKAPPGGNP